MDGDWKIDGDWKVHGNWKMDGEWKVDGERKWKETASQVSENVEVEFIHLTQPVHLARACFTSVKCFSVKKPLRKDGGEKKYRNKVEIIQHKRRLT